MRTGNHLVAETQRRSHPTLKVIKHPTEKETTINRHYDQPNERKNHRTDQGQHEGE